MAAETDASRAKRLSQRILFDLVAELYDSTRCGYPRELVEFIVTTAGVGTREAVLEVGCGTGQLTRQLASYDFELSAIDIGPALIDRARQNLADTPVRFDAVPFEAFDAPGGTFGLIVSATAFHWVDPTVAWSKAARLLRAGGWLALLETGEKYDDPFGSALMRLWIGHSSDGGAWTSDTRPTVADNITEIGLFGQPILRSHGERRTLAADVVLGLEQTRATALSFDEQIHLSFTSQLRALVGSSHEVGLEQQSSLTMAQVLPRSYRYIQAV